MSTTKTVSPIRSAGVPEYRLEPTSACTILIHKWGNGIPYTVGLDAKQTPFVCTCRGWYYRKDCKHMRMVSEALEMRGITFPGVHSQDDDPEEDVL